MSLEKILYEETSQCKNCGRQSLSFLLVDGMSFCNWICFSEWRWRKSKVLHGDNVGKGWPFPTIPQQDVKKVNNLEKGFQTDGNQRDTPPFRWLKMRLRRTESYG